MVDVTTDGGDVVFRTRGHRWYVGPEEVRVPRAHIVAARQEPPRRPIIAVSLKNRGLWVPGRVVVGYYKIRGRHAFYDIRHRHLDNVVMVELRDERYDVLYVEVEDPAAVLALLPGASA